MAREIARVWRLIPFTAVLLAFATGCATAFPSLASGGSPGTAHVDAYLGASARIGGAALRSSRTDRAAASGIVPFAALRTELAPRFDIGMSVAPVALRTEVRMLASGDARSGIVVGLAATAARQARTSDGAGEHSTSVGGDASIVGTVDAQSLYRAHLGGRVAATSALGSAQSTEVRVEALVGVGLGFRRVVVLAEVAVGHAWVWEGSAASERTARGFTLTPAFGVGTRF